MCVLAVQLIVLSGFVGCYVVRRCTCLCGSVASVLDSDIPGHWLALGPLEQCAAIWAFHILQNQIITVIFIIIIVTEIPKKFFVEI